MSSQEVVVTAPPRNKPDGDLTLSISGQEISGWQEIEVTLRAEAFPNSFAVGLSSTDQVVSWARAGAPCTVRLGNDQVLTGYIDRVTTGGSPSSHSISVIGRGKTQDLVDCSGEWPSGQLVNGDALSIAAQLAEPYGINVELGVGASAGEKVPQWLLNYGETAAAIIQRLARNAGLLAYEDAHGTLVLAKIETEQAASGVMYGGNVQAWSCEASMDQRFSNYVCALMSTDALIDLPGGIFYHEEKDPNVPRHRQMDLVLETVATDPQSFTIQRARWEAARRAGRSTIVNASVDSWRDSAGALWRPNTIVPVQLPGNLAGSALVLSEVTFRRSNEGGTTADLVLMPREAFTLEPIVLQPVNTADVAQLP